VASTAARTLSQRELNRALLARQLLLERSPAPIPRALERIGGLQAQYAPSMYIGLWSRLKDFERDSLTRALERRAVVQGTLMRVTIHLVSAGDYWPLTVAIRDARRESWLRGHRGRVSARDIEPAVKRLKPRLAEGPLSRAELDELLGKPGPQVINGLGLWIDLVRSPPSGTWERRRADIYAAADDWLGPPEVTREQGLQHLLRRYLSGFGPASRHEIADWAGLPVRQVASALEQLPLRRFRAEDGEELVDVPRAPLPDPDTPAPVRFLPTWDATLLVHARRTGILPEEYRPRVFNVKTPQSVPTFLVDGAVAGTWRYDNGKVEPEPFGRLGRATLRELRAEAERLAAFHA
jgi:Winged helix DNA-binding domain